MMSEELVQAFATGKAAGKAARGKQAGRKGAVGKGTFADALATLVSARKAEPGRAAAAGKPQAVAAGVDAARPSLPPAVADAPAAPESQAARAKESRRRSGAPAKAAQHDAPRDLAAPADPKPSRADRAQLPAGTEPIRAALRPEPAREAGKPSPRAKESAPQSDTGPLPAPAGHAKRREVSRGTVEPQPAPGVARVEKKEKDEAPARPPHAASPDPAAAALLSAAAASRVAEVAAARSAGDSPSVPVETVRTAGGPSVPQPEVRKGRPAHGTDPADAGLRASVAGRPAAADRARALPEEAAPPADAAFESRLHAADTLVPGHAPFAARAPKAKDAHAAAHGKSSGPASPGTEGRESEAPQSAAAPAYATSPEPATAATAVPAQPRAAASSRPAATVPPTAESASGPAREASPRPVTPETGHAAAVRGTETAAGSAPIPAGAPVIPPPGSAAAAEGAVRPVRQEAQGRAFVASESGGARESASTPPPFASFTGNPGGEPSDSPRGGDAQPFLAAAQTVHRAEPASTFSTVSEAPRTAPPDFAPLHEQVTARLATLPDGAHEVALRLSPEHLGDLQIDLRLSGGRMDATVRAENPEAREALLRDVPALREALATNGITLSSFDVSLSGGGNLADQRAPQQAGAWEQGSGNRQRNGGGAEAQTPDPRTGRVQHDPSAAGAGGHWIA